jgi:hypothetical protein
LAGKEPSTPKRPLFEMTPPSTPKQPRLDEAASVFAVTTPKASASRGIASFLDSVSSDDQDQLDNLLTKFLSIFIFCISGIDYWEYCGQFSGQSVL